MEINGVFTDFMLEEVQELPSAPIENHLVRAGNELFMCIEGEYRQLTNSLSSIINVESYPYLCKPTDIDCTDRIQQAINDIVTKFESGVLYIPRVYNITALTVPGAVSIFGNTRSQSGFNRIAGKKGAGLRLTPYKGKQGGFRNRQVLKDFVYDGNIVGVNKGTGNTTLNSDLLTNASFLGNVNVGDLIEGIGIPNQTKVLSINGSTIQMSKVATMTNGTKTRCVVRKAITINATGVNGNKILTAASTVGIEPGMRCYGSLLEDDPDSDADGFSTWTQILNVTSDSIVLDRPVKASGTFEFTALEANDGILIVDVKLADGYIAQKEYEGVTMCNIQITQAGYHGLSIRPGRDQCHLRDAKVDSCYGYGIFQSSSSDCWQERVGTGSHWYSGYYCAFSATPRFAGEIWQTYLLDRYADAILKRNPEFVMADSDINGRLTVIGKDDELQDLITLTNVNFKFTTANLFPDGTAESYVKTIKAAVIMMGGGFKPDKQDGSRPKYLGITSTEGVILFANTHFVNDNTNPDCPFSVGITDEASIVRLSGVIDTLSGYMHDDTRIENIFNGGTVDTKRHVPRYVFRRVNGAAVASLNVKLPTGCNQNELSPEYCFGSPVTALNIVPPAGTTLLTTKITAVAGEKVRFIYDKANLLWIQI